MDTRTHRSTTPRDVHAQPDLRTLLLGLAVRGERATEEDRVTSAREAALESILVYTNRWKVA